MRGTCGFPSLRQYVHASVLGCDTLDGKGIAERLGLNYQTFMSSVSGQPKHKLDADWLLPIMATTGSVEPLQFMAREMGGVFVKVKPCTGTADLMDTLISSVKEFGEYAAECAEDIRDGRLPRDQHDRILKEGQEALASIASMMQKGSVEDGRVPLVFITHAASEQSMQAALASMNPDVCRLESMIRVED